MQNIVIIGATSAIAQHCARLWVQGKAVHLTLVGRDMAKLERVAADLNVRSPQSDIRAISTEFYEPTAIEAVVSSIVEQAGGPIDIVLIAHGALPGQLDCQEDLSACSEALMTNGVSPILFLEAFARHMSFANSGRLAVLGSVAGDRGRKSNYTYGAAKGMVERYTQGMQHRLAGTGCKVVLIKLGPTDTPMTSHLKASGAKLAPIDLAALGVVSAVERGARVAYIPGRWRLIMSIIKSLPFVIFRRLDI